MEIIFRANIAVHVCRYYEYKPCIKSDSWSSYHQPFLVLAMKNRVSSQIYITDRITDYYIMSSYMSLIYQMHLATYTKCGLVDLHLRGHFGHPLVSRFTDRAWVTRLTSPQMCCWYHTTCYEFLSIFFQTHWLLVNSCKMKLHHVRYNYTFLCYVFVSDGFMDTVYNLIDTFGSRFRLAVLNSE